MNKLATWSILAAAALGATPAWAVDDIDEEVSAKDVSESTATAPTTTTPTTTAPTTTAPTTPPTAAGAKPDDAGGLSPIDGVVGHFGLGYFTSAAPIGVRYWLDRTTGLDLGVDFALSSGGASAHRYGLDLAYVVSLAHYHYSVVFARAGVSYRYLDTFGEKALPARHDIGASAFVGAELFLGAFGFPNISLMGGYGVSASYTYNAGSAFIVGAISPGLNIIGTGSLGFHIYL
jgi:hypothetical protein